MRVSFFFAWYDLWCGAFYDRRKRIWYVCLLPCCVIKIELGDPLNEVCPHGCHIDDDYGFVVMAGCPDHD